MPLSSGKSLLLRFQIIHVAKRWSAAGIDRFCADPALPELWRVCDIHLAGGMVDTISRP
jgi:hypothetical protein